MSQNPDMNAPYGQQPGYAAPGTAPAQSGGGGLVPGGALAIVGGVIAIVGVFLSWANVSLSVTSGEFSQSYDMTISGLGKYTGAPGGAETDSAFDGYVVIAAGIIALIGGLLAISTKNAVGAILALIGGVVAAGLAVFDLSRIGNYEDEARAFAASLPAGVDLRVSASTGIGLWIVIVGGAVALIGGIVAMAGGRKRV